MKENEGEVDRARLSTIITGLKRMFSKYHKLRSHSMVKAAIIAYNVWLSCPFYVDSGVILTCLM